MGYDPCNIDTLCARSGLTPETVSAMLLQLELAGKVAACPAGDTSASPERADLGPMFDILVYLFENYYQTDLYPDQDALARKLTAAGFENDDISDALDWLHGLSKPQADPFRRPSTRARLPRLRRRARAAVDEGAASSPSSRAQGAHAVAARDHHRARHGGRGRAVELEKLKVIVLMVLWTRRGNVDTLILEELLPDGGPRHIH